MGQGCFGWGRKTWFCKEKLYLGLSSELEVEFRGRKESPANGLHWVLANTCAEPLLNQPLPELDRSCHSDALTKEV